MDRTDAKIGTPETQARSATVHAIDSELDYLASLIAKCRKGGDHPAIGTLQAQLASWNKGGNRTELRKLIPRTIRAISGGRA